MKIPIPTTTTISFRFTPFSLHFLKNPTLKPCPPFSLHFPFNFSSQSSPMAPSLVADYAKSNRSTCKTCSNTIAAKSLRLGVVTKDKQKGFDMTKWHHFDCLSFQSVPVASVQAIAGFDSLKSDDQEALKKLMEKCDEAKDKDGDEADDDTQKGTKKRKPGDRGEDIPDGKKQKAAKKWQLSTGAVATAAIALALSDIKDKYKEAHLGPKWKAFDTVIFLEKDDGLRDSSKIAAFDFDGCLAKTSVKRIGPGAWSLMYPSIPDKLQKLYEDGFKLVIFTNESNIDRWKNKRQVAIDSKIGRLNDFIKRVKVPIQVFIACGFDKSGSEDPYRKPKPGMWHVMEKHFNSGISVDMDQSFYVGDAAGRENDHSDADIKFAQAIGLKFYLPEEYFTI